MDDRATMLALHLFEATVEARRAEHRNAVMEREDKGGKGDSAESDYRKLKDRMRTRAE